MQARRDRLEKLEAMRVRPDHAGLWFDRYLARQLQRDETVPAGEKTPHQALVEEVSTIPVPSVYEGYYRRWRAALQERGVQYREARVQGRLAVGLGAESVIETAMRLHHSYGVPIIPGSALKGLAATFAHQKLEDEAWRQGGKAHEILFGSTTKSGFVTFYDALYVPGSGQPLYPDVITVHHPEYYQGAGVAPADWDNPNPVSFLSATGRFLVALGGDYPIWINAAFDILSLALEQYGVGAKTSSGYGRLLFDNGKTITQGQSVRQQRAQDTPMAAPPPGYQRGRVKKFGLGPSQSFGFITPDGGGRDVFVHVEFLASGLNTLHEGQVVYYRTRGTSKGIQAEDVRLA